MRFGYRRPSLKKSIKARTTGKLKRRLKKSINPYYGRKGTGWINHPRKTAYNRLYSRTTKSMFNTRKPRANNGQFKSYNYASLPLIEK